MMRTNKLHPRFVNARYLSSGKRKDVFKAYDRTNQEWVAVKVARVEDYHTNLEELAPVLRRLNHPNIVRIIDIGRNPADDSIFVEEELLDSTLDRNCPIRPKRLLVALLYEICSGLAHLHSQDPVLVHRDLKPENCGIKHGVAKLFDFGTVSSLGLPSLKYGNPGTRPPEMLARALIKDGKQRGFKVQQDIWALGCTAFYIASGDFPFISVADSMRIGAAEDILYRGDPGDKVGAKQLIIKLISKGLKPIPLWKAASDSRIQHLPELHEFFDSTLCAKDGKRLSSKDLKEMLRNCVRQLAGKNRPSSLI